VIKSGRILRTLNHQSTSLGEHAMLFVIIYRPSYRNLFVCSFKMLSTCIIDSITPTLTLDEEMRCNSMNQMLNECACVDSICGSNVLLRPRTTLCHLSLSSVSRSSVSTLCCTLTQVTVECAYHSTHFGPALRSFFILDTNTSHQQTRQCYIKTTFRFLGAHEMIVHYSTYAQVCVPVKHQH